MKKLLLALAGLSVLAVIISAGCVTPVTPPTVVTPTGTPSVVDDITPVQEILIDKTGTIYNVGETYIVVLPSNPTTGYDWEIIEDGGFNITKEYIAPDTNLAGAGGKDKFTIVTEKAGTSSFTLKYMRSFEGEDSAIYTYVDTLTVADFHGVSPMEEPRAFALYSGSMNVKAGEYIKISAIGNPTTGYMWTAKETDGLKISEPFYESSSSGLLGSGGVYSWFVTADKAGKYVFAADYKRPSENEPISSFDLDLIFTEKEA